MTTRRTFAQNHQSRWDGVDLEAFSSIGDWTATLSGPTIVADASYGGLRFEQVGTTGNSYITQDQAVDLRNGRGMWVLWRNNHLVSAGLALTAYMSHLAGLAGGSGRVSLSTGWNNVAGKQARFVANADWAVLDGSPNLDTTLVQSWRYRLDESASSPRGFTMLGISQKLPRGQVLLTFDDGRDSQYSDAAPYAESKGLPLTLYVIAQNLGAVGFVTESQLADLAAAGHDVQAHGAARWDTNLALMDADKAAIRALGYASAHAAWPETQYGTEETWQANIAYSAQRFSTARVGGGFYVYPGHTEPQLLPGVSLNNTTSLATAKAHVDRAALSGGTFIFIGHKLGGSADSETWVTADFQALCDYIAIKRTQGLIDAPTISQWYSGLSGARRSS